jgi:hypothetical protein
MKRDVSEKILKLVRRVGIALNLSGLPVLYTSKTFRVTPSVLVKPASGLSSLDGNAGKLEPSFLRQRQQ